MSIFVITPLKFLSHFSEYIKTYIDVGCLKPVKVKRFYSLLKFELDWLTCPKYIKTVVTEINIITNQN